MKQHHFQVLSPTITNNPFLRVPQREAYDEISKHFNDPNADREVGIVLPVGCGKSGLIAIAPFAVRAQRVLVLSPGLRIADQLFKDFDPTSGRLFYQKCRVLPGPTYPEPAEIRGDTTNKADLDEADVVITNIQQLQGVSNKWLSQLPPDYFDLILVDEGHHNVAESWEGLRQKFPTARIVNFSATPTRADGQLMAGKVIYSFPIFKAIAAGFIKRLKAVVLNPATLKYVRREDDHEVEVSLEEVKRLGEEDSDFRRSIVSSKETLATIVDCSIRELVGLRSSTGDKRHKIIASALNYHHCIQIVEAYAARGFRAAYIHSREDSATNDKILGKLENHELDVIVQVRKLGEGFDHPYLSVAAVCSIFRNLSPFVQFVGRIMRAIVQNEPDNALNRGVVVFHAGANVARVWTDLQEYSRADQDYFDQLLPMEEVNFIDLKELQLEPKPSDVYENPFEIKDQERVAVEVIPLLLEDAEVRNALELFKRRGITPEIVNQLMLQPLPTTKQKTRQAAKGALDAEIRNAVGRVLGSRSINPKGKTLDRVKPPRENFVVIKALIDKKVNKLVGRKEKERGEFTQVQIDRARSEINRIVKEVEGEVFDAKA